MAPGAMLDRAPQVAVGTTLPRAANVPEWLVDNAEAYDRVLRAIGSARGSVWMTQLAFDADCVAYGRGAASPSPAAGDTVVAEALLGAVARTPVDVRILLNATLLLDTARPLRRFFAGRLVQLTETGRPEGRHDKPGRPVVPGRIQVRGVSCFPQLLHAKMVIVDGTEAFLLGSPFVNGYWDDDRHHPVDCRRPLRELGGRPLHDLSLQVTGAPVATLERLFADLWSAAGADSATPNPHRGPDLQVGPTAAGDGGGAAVRIVSTSPRGVLRNCAAGSTEIMDALLEGVAGARSCIYIEHQYLSARPVVAALAMALRLQTDLEIIVVLNQNPDVTAYRRWQNARLAESGLLTHPRVGLFALWSTARPERGSRPRLLNQVFVHSKVVVVDDEWATVGSANLDGVSLHSYGDDFQGVVARRMFRHVRNFDVNVVVDDRLAGGSRPRTIASLRTRLWSEHLDMSIPSLTDRPHGGWLPLWRARAAANVAALAAAPEAASSQMRGFVLPYSVRPTPAQQLADLGVRVDPARLDVRFTPGWLEVHFSPNWVRNMFS